jgi:replication-associated recombination protein RarA
MGDARSLLNALATLYLANAPKSNSIMGFFDALAAVESERQSDVPNPLKDNSRDKEGFGHGKGYPHILHQYIFTITAITLGYP